MNYRYSPKPNGQSLSEKKKKKRKKKEKREINLSDMGPLTQNWIKQIM